jgi:invasion protein IalB
VALRETEPEATLHSQSHGRAVLPLSARVAALGAAVVATALVAAAAAQSAPRQRLQAPLRSDIGRATVAIKDSTLSAKAAVPAGSWGGTYRVPTGESVTVYASNAYPVDPAMGQRWADFLDTLVHGSELSSVIVFLAPDAEVGRLCGTDAVACYSSRDNLLVAPGQDPGADLSAEAVVTHEYGHHVAGHRINPPWSALDYGTKRWASAMQVCARAKKGALAPGAEDPVQYDVNPGEGFAESYRVLNERLAGLAETPWQIVSNILYPSDSALTMLQQDVTNPWSQQAATTSTVRFTQAARTRTYTVATPFDGTMRVSLHSAAGLRVSFDLLAGGKPVAHTAGTGTVARSATVCGQRSYKIRVRALRGNGAVTVSVAKP